MHEVRAFQGDGFQRRDAACMALHTFYARMVGVLIRLGLLRMNIMAGGRTEMRTVGVLPSGDSPDPKQDKHDPAAIRTPTRRLVTMRFMSLLLEVR